MVDCGQPLQEDGAGREGPPELHADGQGERLRRVVSSKGQFVETFVDLS